MKDKFLQLDSKLFNYIKSVSLREPEVLTQLRQETSKLPGSIMQIAPEQGQFMTLLVQLMGAKKTLDIGVFTGYSSLVVALALPENGMVVACDIDEKTTAVAQHYWKLAGVDHKIKLHLAPALETLDRLIEEGQNNTFDFAFVDADKRNYDNYYERALKLLRSGGLIIVDNVLWSGRVADETDQDKRTIAIRDFNQKLSQDARVQISLIPVADGLTLALKK